MTEDSVPATPADAVPAVNDTPPGVTAAAPETVAEPQFRMQAQAYIDQSGRQVTEMTCVKGIAPRDVVRFMLRGEIKIQSKQPAPKGGPAKQVTQPIPVQLAVQAESLDHAFEIYDATLRDYGEKYV